MRTLSKLLIAVVLVTVGPYVALKTYLYQQTKSSLQQLTQIAAPFVAIEYRAISSDLWSGSIQVEGIKFRPTGINDTVSVGAVAFSAGDLRHLLKLMRQFKDREPPESMQVALREVKLDLNGELASFADRFLTAAAAANPAAAGVAHCGFQLTSSMAFLRKLGYGALITDVAVDYTFNATAKWLKLGLDLKMHDMSRVVVDVKLGGVQADMASLQAMPQVREFGFVLQDLSYKERLKSYCARTAQITEADYINAELGPESMFFRPWGIVPGPGLQQAYREFLAKPNGEIDVRVQPSAGFEASAITLYKPADLIGVLNVVVRVNGKRVEDLSVQSGAAAPEPPKAPPETRVSAPPALNPVQIKPPVSAEREAADPSGFRAVRIPDLSRYVNHYVRLYERGQVLREGTLMNISGDTAVLERQYGSGQVVVNVSLRRVEKAEVQF